LRHTYASLLLEAGTAPLIVARQLGHSTMQTVIHTYAHLTDDFIDLEFRRRFRPGFIANLELGTL
jgi:integrase